MDGTQHAMGVRIRWCAAKHWTGGSGGGAGWGGGAERQRKEPLVQQFVLLGSTKEGIKQFDEDSRGKMD